ncbi:MAG: CBS domain-containing protein [Bacillota bacterium]
MEKRVEEVMTAKVVSATPDTPLQDIAALMVNKKFNRIPIVKDKKVLGIITRGDILHAIKKEF